SRSHTGRWRYVLSASRAPPSAGDGTSGNKASISATPSAWMRTGLTVTPRTRSEARSAAVSRRLKLGQPDQIRHSRVDSELHEQRRDLTAMMSLVVEEVAEREPERIAPRDRA